MGNENVVGITWPVAMYCEAISLCIIMLISSNQLQNRLSSSFCMSLSPINGRSPDALSPGKAHENPSAQLAITSPRECRADDLLVSPASLLGFQTRLEKWSSRIIDVGLGGCGNDYERGVIWRVSVHRAAAIFIKSRRKVECRYTNKWFS